jgi:hypothetical protein
MLMYGSDVADMYCASGQLSGPCMIGWDTSLMVESNSDSSVKRHVSSTLFRGTAQAASCACTRSESRVLWGRMNWCNWLILARV